MLWCSPIGGTLSADDGKNSSSLEEKNKETKSMKLLLLSTAILFLSCTQSSTTAPPSKSPSIDLSEEPHFQTTIQGKGEFIILKWKDGAQCPDEFSDLEYAEALRIAEEICDEIAKEWEILRLGSGASMDGKLYGCGLKEVDDRKFGSSLCKFSL